MTGEAALTIKGGAGSRCGLRMRIVAGSAPHAVSRSQLAFASSELFGMIRCRPLSACLIPDENGQVICKQVARTKRADSAPRPRYSCRARQMALLTDTVSPGRIELRGIHNVTVGLDVLFAGTVTTFAPDAVFEKRRIEIAILGIRDGLRLAGMTVKARLLNGLRQIDILFVRIAGREVQTPD